ncbi:hypothetical protein D081_1572 [Anaerovibrio sp. JC8]|nr:hypothetical protein D081_1572 [Anaerovibrio sp. JC8]
MDHLNEKNPKLHRQAQIAENARTDLENQLASCQTKEEARNALMSALNQGAGRTAKGDEDKQIIDNQASEASAIEQMLTTLMTQIKTSLGASTEAGKTAEIAQSAKAIRADVTDATEAAMPLPPLKSTAPAENDQDILETFLFKIRALQNAWDKFVHTSDYKAMPEGIEEAGKQQPDSRVMDMIKLYNPNKMQARVSAASNVDIVQ